MRVSRDPPSLQAPHLPQWTWWQGRGDNVVRIEEQVKLRQQYGFEAGKDKPQ